MSLTLMIWNRQWDEGKETGGEEEERGKSGREAVKESGRMADRYLKKEGDGNIELVCQVSDK